MTAASRGYSFSEIHLPKNFRHVRLELAREPGTPEGSSEVGYLLWLPLRSDGKIDAEPWKEFRDFYRVLKFRPGKTNEIGHLVHRNDAWTLHYNLVGEDEDEAGFHFSEERFVPGEYVSIHAGEKMRVYKVSTVEHF